MNLGLNEKYIINKFEIQCLIDFFDGWSTSTTGTASTSSSWCTTRHASRHTTWHTSRHATRSSTGLLVKLSDDRIANSFDLFLFILELINFSQLVSIKPLNGLITLLCDSFLITLSNFVLELFVFNSRFHVEAVRFQIILSTDSILLFFIFCLVLFCIIDHFLNLF